MSGCGPWRAWPAIPHLLRPGLCPRRGVRRNAPPYPTIPITITLGRVYDHQLGEMHEETILVSLAGLGEAPQALASLGGVHVQPLLARHSGPWGTAA